jgi:hypothetical protein
MKSCWEVDADLRPTFKMIMKKFSQWEKEMEDAAASDSSNEGDDDAERNRADSIIDGAPGETSARTRRKNKTRSSASSNEAGDEED